MSSTRIHTMANLQHVSTQVVGLLVQQLVNIGPIWSNIGPICSNIGPIWSNMVGFGPTSGQKQSKKIVFPKCPTIDWEWVLWSLGVLGTGFYYIIISLFIIIRDLFFLLFIIPTIPIVPIIPIVPNNTYYFVFQES